MDKPIDMVLFCPNCGMQHIDAPAEHWTNPPHRSHLCGKPECGHVWRPADVPTNGVAAVKTRGKDDSSQCRSLPTMVKAVEKLLQAKSIKSYMGNGAFERFALEMKYRELKDEGWHLAREGITPKGK